MDNKELLAVLDMSEDEQIEWLRTNVFTSMRFREWIRTSLADLAFRLRDEAKGSEGVVKYGKAMQIVCDHFYKCENTTMEIVNSFAAYVAKPIHWIIAALIAKNNS